MVPIRQLVFKGRQKVGFPFFPFTPVQSCHFLALRVPKNPGSHPLSRSQLPWRPLQLHISSQMKCLASILSRRSRGPLFDQCFTQGARAMVNLILTSNLPPPRRSQLQCFLPVITLLFTLRTLALLSWLLERQVLRKLVNGPDGMMRLYLPCLIHTSPIWPLTSQPIFPMVLVLVGIPMIFLF